MSNTALQMARSQLRAAMDRQSRADNTEDWLADEAAIARAERDLLANGGNVEEERASIERDLAHLDPEVF